ncbi:ATP-binding protein [Streptomyces fradiae]|uniref:ATP-binding protein n=1 Tax=Streptomyces fradiae TaxID=1906 RepID=UPI0029439CE9|nr:ATP-binding protein [Streptomyces fradiae]WOI62651.1 ATP-binding protein [Streptomyces fradiae]
MVGVSDIDGESVEWTLPGRPASVRAARGAVRDTLRAWRFDPALDDLAVLLVSELVTNSVRYADGPVGLRLTRLPASQDALPHRPALLVEVSDPVPDPPRPRAAGPDDEGGRGLRLVACSARRWGTRRGRTGKTVWFELSPPG